MNRSSDKVGLLHDTFQIAIKFVVFLLQIMSVKVIYPSF